MFLSFFSEVIETIVIIIFTVVLSNSDRLIKYYRRRINWFRPEFDGKSFNVVTSSRKKVKPKDLPKEYRKEDKTVIGDMEPVLTALEGRTVKIKHYLPEKFQKFFQMRIDENVMTFGGEVGNDVTAAYLDRLKCPLRFDGYKIVDHRDQIEYSPKWDQFGRIRKDFALIVRAPNPFNKDLNTVVYIFAGIHKPGTLGAALFTQEQCARVINDHVKDMKAFAVLAEIEVDYLGLDQKDPIITPKSIARVYDLPYKHYGVNY